MRTRGGAPPRAPDPSASPVPRGRPAAVAPAAPAPPLGPGGPVRIQTVAELSGVPAATLRAWERRYGVPRPERTAAAYRLYGADDVALVRRMKALCDAGVSAAEAARTVLAEDARAALADAPAAPAPPADLAAAPPTPFSRLAERLLDGAMRWDAQAIDTELLRLAATLDAQSLYGEVVEPVLAEVGRRWASGHLSVGQEHLLSERIELLLRALLRATDRREGPLVVAGCVAGEQHVLGLLGAALGFTGHGARVTLLGADTPPSAVEDAVRGLRPALVALSCAVAHASPQELFWAYGKAVGGTPWVVGGPGAALHRQAIEAAGGVVASGSARDWQRDVRAWLRPVASPRPAGRPRAAGRPRTRRSP